MTEYDNKKVWNEDLVRAMTARHNHAVLKGRAQQYMWQKAADAIRKVRKNIHLTKAGKTVNVPAGIPPKVVELILKIMLGLEPIIPDGMADPGDPTDPNGGFVVAQPAPGEDPYLKRLRRRSGAYAILMAFHRNKEAGGKSHMFKSEIITKAQPFCDEEMEANHFGGRDFGAWSSIRTLEQKGYVARIDNTRDRAKSGFMGGPRDMFALTAEGDNFIAQMLAKWPEDAPPSAKRPRGLSDLSHSPLSLGGAGVGIGGFGADGNIIIGAPLPPGPVLPLSWGKGYKLGDGRPSPKSPARSPVRATTAVSASALAAAATAPSPAGASARPIAPPHVVTEDPAALQARMLAEFAAARAKITTALPVAQMEDDAMLKAAIEASKLEYAAKVAQKAKLPESKPKPSVPLPSLPKVPLPPPLPSPAPAATPKRVSFADLEEYGVARGVEEEEAMLRLAVEESKKFSPPRQQHPEEVKATVIERGDFAQDSQEEEAIFLEVVRLSRADEERKQKLAASMAPQPAAPSTPLRAAPAKVPLQRRATAPSSAGKRQREKPEEQKRAADDQVEDTLAAALDPMNFDEAAQLRWAMEESTKSQQPSQQQAGEQPPPSASYDGTVNEGEADDDEFRSPQYKAHFWATHRLVAMIDIRERERNNNPRGMLQFLTRNVEALKSQSSGGIPAPCSVQQAKLELGDFAWGLRQSAVTTNGEGRELGVVDMVVERKCMADLVASSVGGRHMEQIARLQLSPLMNCFLLLEGDIASASGIVALDRADDGTDTATTIQDGRDVLLLVGGLVARGSRVKLLVTPSTEVSCRMMAHLTACAAAEAELHGSLMGFQEFNKTATPAHSRQQRREISSLFSLSGLPEAFCEAIADRFGSRDGLTNALMECDPEVAPSVFQHIAARSLGLTSATDSFELSRLAWVIATGEEPPPVDPSLEGALDFPTDTLHGRRVHVLASQPLFKLFCKSGAPAGDVVLRDYPSSSSGSWAMIEVKHFLGGRSHPVVLVRIDGEAVMGALKVNLERLTASNPTDATNYSVALAAVDAVLYKDFAAHLSPECVHLKVLVIEGFSRARRRIMSLPGSEFQSRAGDLAEMFLCVAQTRRNVFAFPTTTPESTALFASALIRGCLEESLIVANTPPAAAAH